MAALAAQHPHACLTVLDRWVRKPLALYYFHRSDELEQVVAIAAGVDDAAAHIARRIVDALSGASPSAPRSSANRDLDSQLPREHPRHDHVDQRG